MKLVKHPTTIKLNIFLGNTVYMYIIFYFKSA